MSKWRSASEISVGYEDSLNEGEIRSCIMGYVDPGSFGVLSQIGYVILLTIMTGLMFFFSPIKKTIRKLRKRTD